MDVWRWFVEEGEDDDEQHDAGGGGGGGVDQYQVIPSDGRMAEWQLVRFGDPGFSDGFRGAVGGVRVRMIRDD